MNLRLRLERLERAMSTRRGEAAMFEEITGVPYDDALTPAQNWQRLKFPPGAEPPLPPDAGESLASGADE